MLAPLCLCSASGSEDRRGGRLPIRVGQVDQRWVAVAPLEAVLELADFPSVRSAPERVLVPAVLRVVVVAVAVRELVPRNVVENPVGAVTVEIDVEVGILMHDDQPLEAGTGEPRPYLRRRCRRRTTGKVEEIDVEGIG